MEQMNVNNPEDDERKEILIENGSVNSAEDVDGDETTQKGNINEAAESVDDADTPSVPTNDIPSDAETDATSNSPGTDAPSDAANNAEEPSGDIISNRQTPSLESAWRSTVKPVLLRFGRGVARIWRKRPKLSFALYAIVFVLMTTAAVLFMQWSVCDEPQYAANADVDETARILDSVAGQLTQFVSRMWLESDWRFLLNFLTLGLIYLAVVAVINRFWVSTALFGTVMVVYAIANKFKIEARNEPIIPADMNFVSGGNTGELLSFIPADSMPLVDSSITGLAWFIGACFALQFLDRRNGLIPVHWRPSRFVSVKNITAAVVRVVAAVVTVAVLCSFVWNLSIQGSWSQQLAMRLSDAPELWNGMGDARNNGPAMTFLRLIHTEVMDEPEDYSENTMLQIAEQYADAADQINANRPNNLTDSTVIMLLSESFSDPTRVPGVTFSQDPMPYIRTLKDTTTSGLMLSPGYGGGTANIEFQALTGLSTALYDPTMSSTYQQLVPNMDDPATFNQLWEADNADGSVAFHPYDRNMYFRDRNYDSFGFDRFYAADGDDQMTDLNKIDAAWYASDRSTYRNLLDYLNAHENADQFIQVVTMQNHMPYDDWYQNNEFAAANTSTGLSEDERASVDTYAKGVSYTDQATAEFLAELDQMDRPISVIFYGDHLPGIYSTAGTDPANVVTLHETDYFIWSNATSASAGTKLPEETAAYTSSNFFMAELAEHMNARVSPFLAFLTKLHNEIAAIGPASLGDGTYPACFDAQGQLIDTDAMSDEDHALLHDYQLIQYDLSVGEDYLRDAGFTTVPAADGTRHE